AFDHDRDDAQGGAVDALVRDDGVLECFAGVRGGALSGELLSVRKTGVAGDGRGGDANRVSGVRRVFPRARVHDAIERGFARVIERKRRW
ncbi:hypothetical protein BE221DRAFT_63107, partial [Ostreococcus tauri]